MSKPISQIVRVLTINRTRKQHTKRKQASKQRGRKQAVKKAKSQQAIRKNACRLCKKAGKQNPTMIATVKNKKGNKQEARVQVCKKAKYRATKEQECKQVESEKASK